MANVQRYAYVNARISVLSARLFDEATFDRFLSSPQQERPHLLHKAGLAFLVEMEKPGPEVLEQGLIAALLDDYTVLLRPLTGSARALTAYWMRRFEISNLKVIVRGKIAGQRRAAIAAQLVDLGRFASLPLEELLHTEDVDELIRYLEQTSFKHIAREGVKAFRKDRDLFALDSAIERHYFNGLAQMRKGLSLSERQTVEPILGALIDQINLVWLMRYRLTYAMAPAEVYYLLLAGGRDLDSKRLMALAQAGSVPEAVAALPAEIARWVDGATDIVALERAMEMRVNKIAWRLLMSSMFSLGRVFAYLLLRERQLLRIHAILKGEYLGLDRADIRRAAGLAAPERKSAAAGVGG